MQKPTSYRMQGDIHCHRNWIRQKMSSDSSEVQNLFICCLITWKDETERRHALWNCWISPAIGMQESILAEVISIEMKQQHIVCVWKWWHILFRSVFFVHLVALNKIWCLPPQDVQPYHTKQMCLVPLMRTPSFVWRHPVRSPAYEGQGDKLFSLKFCAQMAAHERD